MTTVIGIPLAKSVDLRSEKKVRSRIFLDKRTVSVLQPKVLYLSKNSRAQKPKGGVNLLIFTNTIIDLT